MNNATATSDGSIGHVMDTSLWVATYRARESLRADALFHDPCAGLLSGERGEKIADAMPNSAAAGWSVVIRTCVIDQYILTCVNPFVGGAGVRTIVNLGCGLDTRPYRLALPADLVWIEVDYPDIIRLKNDKLAGMATSCKLERIAVDLADASARQNFLKGVGARTGAVLVLTEGVLPYLSNKNVAELADDLVAQKNICFWIVDYFSPLFLKIKRTGKLARKLKNAPFLFEPRDWHGFFREHGWVLSEIRYLFAEGKARHRSPPTSWIMKGILFFASGARRKAMEQMMGYTLLKRGPKST